MVTMQLQIIKENRLKENRDDGDMIFDILSHRNCSIQRLSYQPKDKSLIRLSKIKVRLVHKLSETGLRRFHCIIAPKKLRAMDESKKHNKLCSNGSQVKELLPKHKFLML